MDLPKFKDVVTLEDSESHRAVALMPEQNMYWSTPLGVYQFFSEDSGFTFSMDGTPVIDGYGPVHRTISTAQQGTPLGRYSFESNGNQFYLFRTLSNLWLSYSYLKSEKAARFDQMEFVFLSDWKFAAFFSYEFATYELDSESAPFVDEGETVEWESPEQILFLQSRTQFAGLPVPPVVGLGPEGLTTTRAADSETKQGPTPPLNFRWDAEGIPRTALVPMVRPDTIPVLDVDQVVEDPGEKEAWAALSTALQTSKLDSFPEYPEIQDWYELGKDTEAARNDTLARLQSWGLNTAAIKRLDLRDLKRHHISRLALDPALATEAHQRVRDLLTHYIDIRDDLEVYLGRIRELVQARFSVQDNVVEQIATKIGNIDLAEEPESAAPAMTAFTVVNAIAAIPGAAVPQIRAIVATVNLALIVYSEYEAGMSRSGALQRNQSSAGLGAGKVTLLEQINRDFIRTGYAVDRVRDAITSDAGALKAWRDANARWPVDTDTMDYAINGVYRKFVWAQLLRVGCVLAWEKYETVSFTMDEYFQGAAARRANEVLVSIRLQDPSIVAMKSYARFSDSAAEIMGGLYSVRVVLALYRLKVRTGELAPDTVREIIVDQGWTPESLFYSSGIEAEQEGDLDPRAGNEKFRFRMVHVADLTRTEAHEILSRLKPAQNTDSA